MIVDGRIGWIGGAGIEDHFQDGRFHDLFLRAAGPVVAQLQLVFLASFRWLGGVVPPAEIDMLFPSLDAGPDGIPAVVLHNAPGRYRPITDAIARLLESAARRSTSSTRTSPTGDDPTHRAGRPSGRPRPALRPGEREQLGLRRGQRFHHAKLLDAGVRILEYPTMLHAKAFVRDGEELLAGTCNLEAWSLKRFFEIDLQVRSEAVASQFDERFSSPAEAVSAPGRRLTGTKERAKAIVFAGLSPLL